MAKESKKQESTFEVEVPKIGEERPKYVTNVVLPEPPKVASCPICGWQEPDGIIGCEVVCRNCGNQTVLV